MSFNQVAQEQTDKWAASKWKKKSSLQQRDNVPSHLCPCLWIWKKKKNRNKESSWKKKVPDRKPIICLISFLCAAIEISCSSCLWFFCSILAKINQLNVRYRSAGFRASHSVSGWLFTDGGQTFKLSHGSRVPAGQRVCVVCVVVCDVCVVCVCVTPASVTHSLQGKWREMGVNRHSESGEWQEEVSRVIERKHTQEAGDCLQFPSVIYISNKKNTSTSHTLSRSCCSPERCTHIKK